MDDLVAGLAEAVQGIEGVERFGRVANDEEDLVIPLLLERGEQFVIDGA